MKLCPPAGCGAVVLHGCELAIGPDGLVDVDRSAAEVLAAHGFQIVDATEPEMALPPAPKELADDEIGTLGRRGLFAFLKERGVAVALPITNEELRRLARAAARAEAASDARH